MCSNAVALGVFICSDPNSNYWRMRTIWPFFCSNKTSIDKVFSFTNEFGLVSGAKVNLLKSSGLWFGSCATTPAEYAGIQWCCVPPKYLGVRLDSYRQSAAIGRGRPFVVIRRVSFRMTCRFLERPRPVPCSWHPNWSMKCKFSIALGVR